MFIACVDEKSFQLISWRMRYPRRSDGEFCDSVAIMFIYKYAYICLLIYMYIYICVYIYIYIRQIQTFGLRAWLIGEWCEAAI